MILGICGRQGSGKSTIQAMIANDSEYERIWVPNRLDYVSQVLNCPKNRLINLLDQYIETDYWHKIDTAGWVYQGINKVGDKKFISLSFAESLKICVQALFGYDFEVLLGLTPENREKREIEKKSFEKCGWLSGRQMLEYFGTDIMRNKFNLNIWIDLTQNRIKQLIREGINICISDVRFDNEYHMIKSFELNRILVVYRNEKDLEISLTDSVSHPSKYSFVKFIQLSDIYIHNNGTLQDLYNQIKMIF